MKSKTIYYYSGTHWDREWYQSFQGFRYRLVPMMNDLIEVLESQPDFAVFHLDGQTIVLEDFLEIEPGKRARLQKLIQDKRLIIGPWYVMPDEYLLSGESLIRNLIKGIHISSEWGAEAWKYGYLCDIFGHIAQMPQIFNGFGISHAAIGRGVNDHTVPAHFLWRSPDGSECITFKLQDEGLYGAFLVALNDADSKKLSGEEKDAFLKERINFELNRSPFSVHLLMDSCDHGHIRKDTNEVLAMLERLYPEAEFKHVNIEQMGVQLEQYRGQMIVRTGELNEPTKKKGFNRLLPNILSSYYPLKQANDNCQTLLEKWVEPLTALAALKGHSIQKTYVDLAWKYLLQNHPHDSICGCSIDQVHKDMSYRFDQSAGISDQLIRDVMDREASKFVAVEGSWRNVVSIWNPLPFARRTVVTVDIDLYTRYPFTNEVHYGYEVKNSFKLHNHLGEEVPYGLVSMRKNWKHRSFNRKVGEYNRHTVTFEADLPAMGYAEYDVVPFVGTCRYLEVMSRHEREVENEHLKLTVGHDGTISIYNKANGSRYEHLLSYLDDGEIGDGYNHANPVEDRLISSYGAPCLIERIENGPVRTVFQITHTITVPSRMEQLPYGFVRSSDPTVLTIRSKIGLSQGASYVDVETMVTNNARDHRLRVSLPTGCQSDTYFVNQPYAFVERKTGVDTSTQDWKECAVVEKQMGGIVGKRGEDGNGIAFVSAYGLHECAATDDEYGSIHVTLLRSFRRTVESNGEEGGQLIGELNYKYAIAPLDPYTSYADLVRLQETLQAGVRTWCNSIGEEYKIAAPTSHFKISNSNICLSALKRPEDGSENEIIIRCYNVSSDSSTARFSSSHTVKNVIKVNMNEVGSEALEHEKDGFDMQLKPWEIQTYRIQFME